MVYFNIRVVKIKYKPILTSVIVFIFLMTAVFAASRQALQFTDVDVRVGGKSDNNLQNGETISDEAQPGDTVEVRVEVKNNFTSADNLDIEDIQVQATLEEIDDGDDLEEESNDFDLSPGNDKRVTFKFQVPLEVDEDSFDILIEADGEDENNTDQSISMRLKLDVEKESHQLRITRSVLSPAEIGCGRRNVQASVTILNTGTEDEDDVTFHLFNEDLGFEIKENVGELEAEPFEETSKFSKTYSFSVPANAEEGSYPITFRALYDTDRRKAETTQTLTVNKCGTGEDESTNDVVVVTPPSTTPVQPTQPVLPPDTTVTSESFFKSNAFVIAIIIAEVIAVIVGIVLIVGLFARRA